MHKSIRPFISALEKHGQLIRIPEADQDQYEATALMYELINDKGSTRSPVVLFERIKIGGEWMEGPIIGNMFGNPIAETIAFDFPEISADCDQMHLETVNKIKERLLERGNAGTPTETIDPSQAHCKEVVLTDANVDLMRFPWLKTNPADGGPYINAGSLVLYDEEFDGNIGVYRMQIKDGKKIGVNAGFSQDGWRILDAMRKRGDTFAPAAVVISPSPIIWAMSSVKVGAPGESEYDLARLFSDAPIDVVQCETNDLLVPADAEMIVEGEIPLDAMEEEGPFGEFLGFLGPKRDENFFMNVTCITHRKDPWFFNAFSGITFDMPRTLWTAVDEQIFDQTAPGFRGLFRLTPFVVAVRIEKSRAGEGMEIGKQVLEKDDYAKVVIVVDNDINVQSHEQVMSAVGAMWQPHPATEILKDTPGRIGDPSTPARGKASLAVIDATRQWPEEGGPQVFAPTNRGFMEDEFKDSFSNMRTKWGHLWS